MLKYLIHVISLHKITMCQYCILGWQLWLKRLHVKIFWKTELHRHKMFVKRLIILTKFITHGQHCLHIHCTEKFVQVSLSQFVIMFLYLTVLMKGHVPSSLNRVVNRTACVIPSCTTKYNIQLKKCSNFTVYYLPRPSSCDQAYCFGKYNITFSRV